MIQPTTPGAPPPLPPDLIEDAMAAAAPEAARAAAARLAAIAAAPAGPDAFASIMAIPAPPSEGLAAPRLAAPPPGGPLRQFESFVVQSLIESMLPKGGALFGEGTAGSMWRSFMAEAIATEATRAGGIGIARMLAPAPGEAGNG